MSTVHSSTAVNSDNFYQSRDIRKNQSTKDVKFSELLQAGSNTEASQNGSNKNIQLSDVSSANNLNNPLDNVIGKNQTLDSMTNSQNYGILDNTLNSDDGQNISNPADEAANQAVNQQLIDINLQAGTIFNAPVYKVDGMYLDFSQQPEATGQNKQLGAFMGSINHNQIEQNLQAATLFAFPVKSTAANTVNADIQQQSAFINQSVDSTNLAGADNLQSNANVDNLNLTASGNAQLDDKKILDNTYSKNVGVDADANLNKAQHTTSRQSLLAANQNLQNIAVTEAQSDSGADSQNYADYNQNQTDQDPLQMTGSVGGGLSTEQNTNFAAKMEGNWQVFANTLRSTLSNYGNQLRITLNPEGLGSLDFKLLKNQAGQISAELSTTSKEVAEYFKNQTDKIRTALLEQGIKLDNLVINVQQPAEGGSTELAYSDQQDSSADANSSQQQIKQGSSKVMANDSQATNTSSAAPNYMVDKNSQIDIRI